MNEEELAYQQIRATGATPDEVAQVAQTAGAANILTLILLRHVFPLDLSDAMQVVDRTRGQEQPLSERAEQLLPLLKQLLDERWMEEIER